MAHLNDKLVLIAVPLTGDWRELKAPVACSSVDATGDSAWSWASDTQGAFREIPPGISCPIATNCSFACKESICWIKGSGVLYVTFS